MTKSNIYHKKSQFLHEGTQIRFCKLIQTVDFLSLYNISLKPDFDAHSVDWPCADFYLPDSNNIFAEISLPKSVYSVTYFNHLSHVNQQRQIDTFSHNVNISLPTLHFTKASFKLESLKTPPKCSIFVHWARNFCKLL